MSNTIILVENIKELHSLSDYIAKNKDAKIYSLDYFTHKFLQNNNIPHIIGETYLTEKDFELIDDKTISTTNNWCYQDRLKEFLTYCEINIATLVEVEIYQYLLAVFRSTFAITKIIEKEKPDSVLSISYLNDFIKKICIEKNIHFRSLENSDSVNFYFDKINIKCNLGSIPISITIPRSLYFKIKTFLTRCINSIFGLSLKNTDLKRKSILLLEFNPASYSELIQNLGFIDKNILLLNQRRPATWNFNSLRAVKNSNCKIVNLDDFRMSISKKLQYEMKLLEKNLIYLWKLDSVFENIFSLNSISFWNSIKDSFTQFCNDRFHNSLNRILLINEFFTKCNVTLVLEWAETGQEEKEILNIAKKQNIKSIMLQHAYHNKSKIWDKSAKFYAQFQDKLISDMQIVWGNTTKEYAISYNHKPENIISAGSPRHDKFFRSITEPSNAGIILLATTSASGGNAEFSTTQAFEKFDKYVVEVIKIVSKLKEKKLVVKPHPKSDFFNNVTELVKKIDPTVEIMNLLL